MNILFIVPYVPNLIRVRPYNLIKSLSGQGHQVTVLTLWGDERERIDLDHLKGYCSRLEAVHLSRWRSLWNCFLALPTHTPLQSVYCWEPALARKIEQALSPSSGKTAFDVVHVEHLRGSRYGLLVKKGSPQLPVVWDSVDCISLLFRRAAIHSNKRFSRWVTRFELERTERLEGWLPNQFDRTMVTSSADREALLALERSSRSEPSIQILPNGVDLDYFLPHSPERREPSSLVISGKMSYHANITMTLNLFKAIMPQIWAKRPDVKLWIVGKDPSREILELGNHPSVNVTGTVDDIRPYLQRATIAVAPLAYGVGIQNKILEALSCATPVVTTPQGVSALDVTPGRDLLVAQDPGSFAEQVLQLLADPHRRHCIGQSGRLYVENHHKWENIAAQLEGAYHELIHTYHRDHARVGA